MEKNYLQSVGKEILFVPPQADVVSLSPCIHEEADTKMMLHSADAVQQANTEFCFVPWTLMFSF